LDDINLKCELKNNQEIAIAKSTKNMKTKEKEKRKATFKLPEPPHVTFANIQWGKKSSLQRG
jgi:hypothetical protein